MRQLTRSEQDVRSTPVRGGRPRTTPQVRRTRPARNVPAAGAAGAARPAAASASASRGRKAPRTPFVLLVVGLLCGGLVSLLVLNTILNQDSFRANELRNGNNELRQKKESLKHQNALMDTPEWLAGNVEKQGLAPDWDNPNVMVPDRPAAGTAQDGASTGTTGSDERPTGQERAPGTGR
ncbi:hypothetical protein [Streptosporangium saharense]|uniref:Cell division protein FtsL n=1 Tax=Streptosporangium saharense TaxID=1706840 RepID=A0A7W7VML3_9ACTN|nr:hypothetical protein [Streptosporangium saharense]MBB4915852.1 hypothetical protein [Streptosporangium saharense]